MEGYYRLRAHFDKEEPWKEQGLLEHLLNVSKRAKSLGSSVGLENTAQLIGLMHDFGKFKENFQMYIIGRYKGRVNHSSLGAIIVEHIQKIVFDKYSINVLLKTHNLGIEAWNLYKEILQYPILAHHGLFDIIDETHNYRVGKRLQLDKPIQDENSEEGDFLNILDKEFKKICSICIEELYYKGFIEFIAINKKIISMTPIFSEGETNDDKKVRLNNLHFYYGSLIRLLLSILKEADIYDSSNYYRDEKDKIYLQEELNRIWDEMDESIEDQYNDFKKTEGKSDLNIIRTSLADEIYEFSKKYGSGIYKLDMPVGSGKTYASMRYAVGNSKKFNKKRILYTTAFLSVLEQNAKSVKDLLGDDYILEHHSNIIQDKDGTEEENDKNEYEISEYLKESWESPIVLTTLVQLSNTFFKERASNIRRFAKLIDSVIIIDEVQSLPTKAIYNFNLMCNFMANIMNVTIVHCTATPPGYDNEKVLVYPCKYGVEGKDTSVIKPIKNIDIFNRVDYYNLLGDNLDFSYCSKSLVGHIKGELEYENSALIVLNTKNAVLNLYNELINDEDIIKENIEVIYLTTNQCPKHRLNIIKYMKVRLKNLRNQHSNKKLVCVSTKLVEAGVDIDFDMAYRSIAGIDNIIQVGGRCNREGKKDSKGKVFIFNYEEEDLEHLHDIKKERTASLTALRILKKKNMLGKTIDMEEAGKFYFHKLYQNEENSGNHMEYITKSKDNTVLDLLGYNKKSKTNYYQQNGRGVEFKLGQSFKTAAKEFDLINENTVSVIVQYNNKKLLDELYESIEKKNYLEIKKILQYLQPYTIGIRNILNYEEYVVRELDGEILILAKEAYDGKIGLTKGELEPLII